MGRPLWGETNSETWEGKCGEHLRKLRLSRFDTQQEFLNALTEQGVTVAISTVSKWELGRVFPKHSSLPTVAEVLGVTVRELYPEG